MAFSPSGSVVKDCIVDALSSDMKQYNSSDPAAGGGLEPTPELVDFLSALGEAISTGWESFTSGLLVPVLMLVGGVQATGNATPYSSGSPPTVLPVPAAIIPVVPFKGLVGNYTNPFSDGDLTAATKAMLFAIDMALLMVSVQFISLTMLVGSKADKSSIAGWINTPPVIAPGPFSGMLETYTLDKAVCPAIPSAAIMKSLLLAQIIAFTFPPLAPLTPGYLELIGSIAEGIANAWFNEWLPSTKLSAGAGAGLVGPGGVLIVGAIVAPVVQNS